GSGRRWSGPDTSAVCECGRWTTEGARRFLHRDLTPYVRDLLWELLRIRFRIRADLGLPEDDLDRRLDEE
ncbi:hypothetical protein PWG71_28605, partial [Nocardiopsis sp. N85]|nr:hypothetical protein [Nocardiopsis sp. N85]